LFLILHTGKFLPLLSFDPEAASVDSIAGEAAIASERLAAKWLRARFLNPPDWRPEIVDEQRMQHLSGSFTPASVLLPLVSGENGLSLLLTQRTAHLTDHAGQISFPGGRAEASDDSAVETALRETDEEIGLHRKHIQVIGTLPDYFTGTGYQITPVVSIIEPPFDLRADPSEVAEIFEVPLSFLMDGANHQRRIFELSDRSGHRIFYAMPYQRYFIWGATAGILRNLFHFLRA
jgi:8-oxo-dGTP pyrophosphatase MutT (NUDIX family)